MKKIYFLILSAFVGFLFMQSCKEDENIDGCKFIDYTFYVEFVNSEGNPVVTKAMEPTDFSIKCIKPRQEYNNFNDLDMSKSQISHNYVKRIIDSATKFNQKLKELGERRQIQIPDDEDEINFMVEAIPSSLSELYTYKSSINNNNKQNSNNQFVEIFKK